MTEENGRLFKTGDWEIDNCTPFAIMEPVWRVVDFYSDANSYLESVHEVSHRQRLMHAVVWYCAEVNNGGHEQFFFNSTGMLWRDAMDGFKEFGLPQLASLVEEAGARLGGHPSMDQDERQSALKKVAPDFDDLDSRYVELGESLSLDGTLLNYIRQHRADFYIEVGG